MATNDRVVWNFPFEMTYRFNDVPGWPKVCLTLTCRDFWGRDVICGYGVMHVPTFPGTHTRYIQVFKPRASSIIRDWFGWLQGKSAEFTNPIDLLNKAHGREVTRVDSVGIVKVKFQISNKNMREMGFQLQNGDWKKGVLEATPIYKIFQNLIYSTI